MMQKRQGGDLVVGGSTEIERTDLHPGEHGSTGAARGERPGGDDVGAGRGGAGTPLFVAPGLVLLAMAAIAAGYHWLHLIPTGAPRPIAVLLAAVVVPATYGLTRHISGPATGWIRTVARGCAILLPALWIVLHVSRSLVAADLLGAVSLALALSLVALAVLSEVGEHQRTGTY